MSTDNRDAKSCTTHHHACDCREARFRELEQEAVDWKKEAALAEANAQKLHEAATAEAQARIEAEKERDALAHDIRRHLGIISELESGRFAIEQQRDVLAKALEHSVSEIRITLSHMSPDQPSLRRGLHQALNVARKALATLPCPHTNDAEEPDQ